MGKMNGEKRGALTRMMLRIFGVGRDFMQSPGLQEEKQSFWHPCKSQLLEKIETVSLELERKKAEALMERQRRAFVC
jgi:hypothetical protein